MAGFGKAKQMEASKDIPPELQNTPQPMQQQGKQPKTQKKADAFADLRAELTNLHQNRPKTHMFVGIAGHENTGKSAIVLDAFVKDEEATKRGDTLEIEDFEGGG